MARTCTRLTVRHPKCISLRTAASRSRRTGARANSSKGEQVMCRALHAGKRRQARYKRTSTAFFRASPHQPRQGLELENPNCRFNWLPERGNAAKVSIRPHLRASRRDNYVSFVGGAVMRSSSLILTGETVHCPESSRSSDRVFCTAICTGRKRGMHSFGLRNFRCAFLPTVAALGLTALFHDCDDKCQVSCRSSRASTSRTLRS